MNRTGQFFIVILLCSALPAMAYDFGLVIQQSLEFTNTGAEDSGEVNYTGSYSPWFSSGLGQTAKLYLSAKISTIYEAGEWKPGNMPILPELGRSEFLWRPETSGLPVSSINLEAGRTLFQDPLGVIAAGLFDGFNGSAVLGQTRLSAVAFYTGLLYKETADIVMTPSDAKTYTDKDNYFASRRLLFSTGVEFPDLTPRSSLVVNGLFQFDVNGHATTLHTQYLTAKYTFLVLETLSLTGTAVMGLAENHGDTSAHFAAAAGADWEVPGAPRDMLQGEIRWSSGAVNKSITAFAPVTGIAQGQVFDPILSGLMIIKGKYTLRFLGDFSASAEGSYSIRTDGETLIGTDYPPSSARLLGGELYGALSWGPVSDFMATMGCGFFFPGMGNVFESDAPILWKIRVGLTLSL
jgi:hypothetical protein